MCCKAPTLPSKIWRKSVCRKIIVIAHAHDDASTIDVLLFNLRVSAGSALELDEAERALMLESGAESQEYLSYLAVRSVYVNVSIAMH